MFQHTTISSRGVPRDTVFISGQQRERKKSIAPLPDDYENVRPLALKEKEPKVGDPAIIKSEMTPECVQHQDM